MYIATAAEIRNIEETTIKEYGIKELVLMENAGKVVADAVTVLLNRVVVGSNVFIAAGTGNNGGDALVAGRHLLNYGAKIKVFFVGNMEHLTQSAKVNYDILQKMKADFYYIESEHDWDKVKAALDFSDIVIDGLCGTGVNLPLRNNYKKMITCLNKSGRKIVSVDMPSGVETDKGMVDGSYAVKATTTVTLGLAKIGLFLYPGMCFVGKIIVDSIGIPGNLLEDNKIAQKLIERDLVKKIIPQRPVNVYKNTCGRVLAVAGSIGYTGAAVLCSEAALRTGAGLVTLAVGSRLYNVFAAKLTEVMVKPLPEEENGLLGEKAVKTILPREESYDTVLIGPGMGREADTLKFIRELALKVKKPLVLDADAVFAFSGHLDELKKCVHVPILTPHLGEMASLLQIKVKDLKLDLWKIVREAAAQYNCIFVLKSEKTIVACPNKKIFLTTVGNRGMATAGCGDTLAGVIAALRADKIREDKAAIAGVYLHGKAGDFAARQGMAGLIAGDIVKNIQAARKSIDDK